MNCIFCNIINHQIPCKQVYENEWVLAFHDIKPMAPVHILVIPKKHISAIHNFTKGDELIMQKLWEAVKDIALELDLTTKGYQVLVRNGKGGGQEVMHLHLHIISGQKF